VRSFCFAKDSAIDSKDLSTNITAGLKAPRVSKTFDSCPSTSIESRANSFGTKWALSKSFKVIVLTVVYLLLSTNFFLRGVSNVEKNC